MGTRTMRIALILCLVILGCAHAWDSGVQVQDIGDAAEEGCTPSDCVTHHGFLSTCVGNMGVSDMVAHCESRTSEEKCTGGRHDWYCHLADGLTCNENKKNACVHINTQAADDIIPAICCQWDTAANSGAGGCKLTNTDTDHTPSANTLNKCACGEACEV